MNYSTVNYVNEIVAIGRSFLPASGRFFESEIGKSERNSSAWWTSDFVNANTSVRVSVRVSRTCDDATRSTHFTSTTFFQMLMNLLTIQLSNFQFYLRHLCWIRGGILADYKLDCLIGTRSIPYKMQSIVNFEIGIEFWIIYFIRVTGNVCRWITATNRSQDLICNWWINEFNINQLI